MKYGITVEGLPNMKTIRNNKIIRSYRVSWMGEINPRSIVINANDIAHARRMVEQAIINHDNNACVQNLKFRGDLKTEELSNVWFRRELERIAEAVKLSATQKFRPEVGRLSSDIPPKLDS